MSVVTPTLLSEGKELDAALSILSIDVRRELNRIPCAELQLVDGDAARRKFALSDGGHFEPGKRIEIKLRYEGGADHSVFTGVTTRQCVEANGDGSVLVVDMKDAAIRLTGPRRSAVFREKSDADVIRGLVQSAGLATGSIASTKPKHPEIVQYYCSDWDFILSRADVHGLLVAVDDGKVSLSKPSLSASAKHTFEWGIGEVFELEMEADAGQQYGSLESIAWNLGAQKLTGASQAKPFQLAQGNLDGGKIAQALGFETYTLSHTVPLDPGELQAWADARMARSRMALLRGRLAVPGLADLKPLDVIAVAGIGERWNGKTLVSGVRHRVEAGSWLTDVQFGLSPQMFCRRSDIADSPAAGLLPAVHGLQIGVVAAFEKDPDNEVRVRVVLPSVDDKKGVVWARLATPEAGKGRGYFFRPEPGDEVVVGFLNDDPRHAVVLGSLYGSKNSSPADLAELSAENVKKGIVTKKRSTLQFHDEEKPSVFIETAKKNRILFDDDGEQVRISDQHGNSVTMNKEGIEINSIKDIKITAQRNIEVTAQTKTVDCSKDVKICATNNVESTSKVATVKCSKNVAVSAGEQVGVSTQTTILNCSKDVKVAAGANVEVGATTAALTCVKDVNVAANNNVVVVGMTAALQGQKDVNVAAGSSLAVNALTTSVNGIKDLKLSGGLSVAIEGASTAIKGLKDVSIAALSIGLKGAKTAVTGAKSVSITAAGSVDIKGAKVDVK